MHLCADRNGSAHRTRIALKVRYERVCKQAMVAKVWNPSIEKAEVESLQVQGQCDLHSKSKAGLGYTSLKTTERGKKNFRYP